MAHCARRSNLSSGITLSAPNAGLEFDPGKASCTDMGEQRFPVAFGSRSPAVNSWIGTLQNYQDHKHAQYSCLTIQLGPNSLTFFPASSVVISWYGSMVNVQLVYAAWTLHVMHELLHVFLKWEATQSSNVDFLDESHCSFLTSKSVRRDQILVSYTRIHLSSEGCSWQDLETESHIISHALTPTVLDLLRSTTAH